jgi:hypothetical protein
MKNFGLCAGIGALAFVLAGYQAGIFRDLPQPAPVENAPPVEQVETKKPAKARFPRDLAPAARAEPVPQAAVYDSSATFHRLAILKTNGELYQDWQDKLKEEWQAETIEDTALVLVLGAQRKIFVEIIPYPNGAPPISRYKFELEASVIEAKTGKVLANRLFVNMPRNIQRIETWNTTALGSPVEFRTVFYWVASGARAGFPPVENPTPIVNVVN